MGMGEDIVRNVEYRPGKLNFNAPLLTTRRPVGMKTLEMPHLGVSRDFTTTSSSPVRIPFSWEQIPGKPKNLEGHVINVDLNHFLPPPPPPKLPPRRWIPEAAEANDNEDGFDGDVEDYCNNEEEDDQSESDAIDVFSLGQSVEEVVEPGDGLVEMFGFEGLIDRDRGGGYHSPNFIIQRFLPDAKALAASTSNTVHQADLVDDHRAISVRRAITKGCGLHHFFPWKMKPKPCGTKNPVVFAAPQFMHRQKTKVVQQNLPSNF